MAILLAPSLRRRLVVTVAATAALVLAGCASSAPGGSTTAAPAVEDNTPKVGGTLIAAWEGALGTMDNNISAGSITSRIRYSVYEGLVNRDYHVDNVAPPVIAGLAESWDTKDNMVWTFKLRKGAKFHDGTPFDADAYIFNVKRVTDKTFPYYQAVAAPSKALHYSYIDKVEKIDDATIKYTLKKPYAKFLIDLAAQPVASPEAIKKYGNDEYGNHPAGTGPFKFTENTPGVSSTMERFDDYWGQKTYLDKAIIRPISEAVTRVAALQAHEVDFINVIHPDYVDQLKANPKITINAVQTPYVWGFMLNPTKPPFNDVRVRRAINLAVDRESMSRDLLKGTGVPATTYAPQGNDVYNPDVKSPWYKYDPAQAKQLMTEAGYPDGFKVKFAMPTDGSFNMIPVPMEEFMANNLKKNLNIDFQVDLYEWQTYISSRPKMAFDNNGGFVSMSYGDQFATFGTGNWVKYNNPKVDELVNQALASPTMEDYRKYQSQAVQVVMDDAVWLAVMLDTEPKAYWNDKVHNFHRPADGNWDLTYIWLSKP